LLAEPKIYDCFIFFNELELLEIKLHELYDHVDYFVLVESTKTFRGTPKPLYFAENKQKFSPFIDKIIHVVVDDGMEAGGSWDREYYQRNQILRGLTYCLDDDIILLEDLDEIVDASTLPTLIDLLRTRPYVTCAQTIYTYYLNRKGHGGYPREDWLGSVATHFADVKRLTPQGIRNLRSWETSIHSGWHFTYMGGIGRVRHKLESFSHSELDNEAYKHPDRIRKDIESIRLVEIDESYPQFIRDHIPYLTALGLIDTGT
jgi:hypothetical protein